MRHVSDPRPPRQGEVEAKLGKNQTHTVTITDLTHEGAGVGRIAGMPVFIPGACVGETVVCWVIQVKKNYAIGKLMSVLTPASHRVQPICPVYAKCGGCQLQHMDYPTQLAWKTHQVQRLMTHVAKASVSVSETVPHDLNSPFRYRHKAIYPFGDTPEGPVLGFYAPHSHRVIPITDCVIQCVSFAESVLCTQVWAQSMGLSVYDEVHHRGVLRALVIRRSAQTGQMVVGLCINQRHDRVLATLQSWVLQMQQIPDVQGLFVCENQEKNNVPLSGQVRSLWGSCELIDRLGGVSLAFGPMSFFQVNPLQAERIVSHIRSAVVLSQRSVVWDLYAGVGAMGLAFAAEVAQVVCVESVPEAAAYCRHNAAVNGYSHVQVITGALESCLDQLRGYPIPDVVILDPPRQGCHPDVVAFLLALKPKTVVYVSCDPATFARDVQRFSERYTCVSVQPVDMFPMTRHVEVVGILRHHEMARLEGLEPPTL